jgi:hypothetical protein
LLPPPCIGGRLLLGFIGQGVASLPSREARDTRDFRFAEASFKGLTHTPESRAQMSDSHTGLTHSEETRAKLSGANHPMYGKVPANAFQSGYAANHPMYGKVAVNALTVNVYSLDGKLIKSFSSQVAAAEWLNTSRRTLSRYIESGGEAGLEQSISVYKVD